MKNWETELNEDCLLKVCSYLSSQALMNLGASSKTLYNRTSPNSFWRKRTIDEYAGLYPELLDSHNLSGLSYRSIFIQIASILPDKLIKKIKSKNKLLISDKGDIYISSYFVGPSGANVLASYKHCYGGAFLGEELPNWRDGKRVSVSTRIYRNFFRSNRIIVLPDYNRMWLSSDPDYTPLSSGLENAWTLHAGETDTFYFFYSVCNRQKFNETIDFIEFLITHPRTIRSVINRRSERKFVVSLIGNNVELTDLRQVSWEDGYNASKRLNIDFFSECSLKHKTGNPYDLDTIHMLAMKRYIWKNLFTEIEFDGVVKAAQKYTNNSRLSPCGIRCTIV